MLLSIFLFVTGLGLLAFWYFMIRRSTNNFDDD